MKTRNKAIILLSIVGVILFILVQGVVIPRNNRAKENYIMAQKNPTSHDLKSILKYKSKYMGDISNVSNLFHNLPLNDGQLSFKLIPENFILQVNYKDLEKRYSTEDIERGLMYNSTAAFALIDNLKQIDYSVDTVNYKVARNEFERLYNVKLPMLLEDSTWKEKVQDKLKDNSYVKNYSSNLLRKIEEF
ncbi:DUF4825 domain-containing protein [Clostridium manihotivorum]|uniref:DUF4825 domain-containing protein n=1 Tax=Clostridium manihotivorum TaxID=2320868 RepID=A0A410DVT0_9CLOT|nr:DUF4825 domain-containing protein [Clostridium manihotivorum]QAA33189.1 DUF4825 domain-containing protein [Clostridium manihotivorum]